MANLKKQTGIRISQYQVAQINDNDKKNKLLLNHNFITYAPSYFGTSTMNKNYQIPVQTLRDDFRGYLGIENAKGTWQNTIRIWSGNWIDTENRENSYVYQWNYDERGNLDYIADKWGDEEDVDKIFLLRNAPIPFEEPQQDPNPKSNKFVDKKYIDDRFNGIRKVKTSGTTLQIRPYPCVYEYSAMPSSINIVDTLTLKDGRKIKDCIEKNCLIFYIKLPTPTSTTLSVKANNVDTKWGFSGELTQLLSTAKNNADSGLIKCYAEYINGTFTVHCTNGMNLKPGEGGTVEIDTTDTIVDGSNAVPTSNAVYDHVKSHENKTIHITNAERTSWNNNVTKTTNHINNDDIHITNAERTAWNSKIDFATDEIEQHLLDGHAHITDAERNFWNNRASGITGIIEGDSIINCELNQTTKAVTLSLNVSDNVQVNENTTVPTTQAVYNYVKTHEEKNIHITSSERTAWNNKVNSVTGDTYIKKSGTTDVSLSLNVADEYNDIIDEIDDDNTANDTNRKTIPNSRTVWEFADISKYFFPYLEHDERKDYILYDTVGNPMYISFIHKLTNGSNMFYGKTQFTSVYLDFPELINGENMFANCSNLENFGTETLNIEKLNNGTNMFNNCSLNATSVGFILEALKNTITTNIGCVMNLTVSASQKQSVIILLNDKYGTTISTDDLTQITSSAISLTNKNGGTWDITITYKQ